MICFAKEIFCLFLAVVGAIVYLQVLYLAETSQNLDLYFALGFWRGVPGGMEALPDIAPRFGNQFFLLPEFLWLVALFYFVVSHLMGFAASKHQAFSLLSLPSCLNHLVVFIGLVLGIPIFLSGAFVYPYVVPDSVLADKLKAYSRTVLFVLMLGLYIVLICLDKKPRKEESEAQPKP